MKICYLISTFYPFVGGGETHARLLCSELVRQGVDVFVLTRRTGANLKKEDVVDGVPVYRVAPCGYRRLAKYFMLAPVFFRLISMRDRYDLILVSGLRYLSLPAMIVARMFGKKCVLRGASCGELSGGFIWDSPHLKNKTVSKSFFKILVQIRNRVLLKADGFLGISEAIRTEYLECGVPDAKIKVINNGTDTDKFRPVDKEERAALRFQLGIPDKKIFAYTGKLNTGKGLDFLLDVWREFVADRNDVHLLLIGSGEGSFLSCEEDLWQFALTHGINDSITFTGYVENVHEYLKCSDIFVFPSENESLSNALIEALACGLPCLASDIGGIPDTVKDGFNGRLLPVGDKNAWLNAMRELLSDDGLALKLGGQGRSRVLEHNSMESVTKRHMDFFQSLM